jgi:hypothetical protein
MIAHISEIVTLPSGIHWRRPEGLSCSADSAGEYAAREAQTAPGIVAVAWLDGAERGYIGHAGLLRRLEWMAHDGVRNGREALVAFARADGETWTESVRFSNQA